MEFPELKETTGKIAERRKQLADIFAEAGPTIDLAKVKSVDGGKDAVLERIRTLNTELDELATKAADLTMVAKAADRASAHETGDGNQDQDPTVVSTKEIGRQFTESAAFKARPRGGDSAPVTLKVDPGALGLKTLMTTAAGFAPESVRSGVVVDFATRPVQITDAIPSYPWDQAAYKYMEETTFTNNAAEVAEGTTYGEAALVYTERSVTVEKITIWIPVTDEQLEEVPFLEARLNTRLPFMIRQRLDGQLLSGNGVTPNIRGVTNVAGIQNQPKGADPAFDAILKGAVKVRTVGFATPDKVLIHATDWQNLRLTRTVDGIYILGNPTDPAPQRIWGLLPVEHTIGAAGTAVVGDYANFSELLIRRDIEVKVSNSHSTFFVEGKQAIRADMRGCAAWLRPTAFCTVTGL